MINKHLNGRPDFAEPTQFPILQNLTAYIYILVERNFDDILSHTNTRIYRSSPLAFRPTLYWQLLGAPCGHMYI